MYKFIDKYNVIRWHEKSFELNGRVYTNPTAEQLKLIGYKPLIQGDIPEYNEAAQMPVAVYSETENAILKSYEIHAIEGEDNEE